MRRSSVSALIVGMVTACSKADDRTPPGDPASTKSPRAALPAEAAKAPARPSVELPAKGFNVADVLGEDVAQVERILGTAEKLDDGRIYDGFARTAVMVMFEQNKAAMVEITAPGFSDTEANRAAVLAWAGATKEEALSSRSGVEIWTPGARNRYERRKTIGYSLGEFLNRTGAGGGHATGELATVMLVRPAYKRPCNRTTLAEFKTMAKREVGVDFAEAGFLTIQCDIDGPSITAR